MTFTLLQDMCNLVGPLQAADMSMRPETGLRLEANKKLSSRDNLLYQAFSGIKAGQWTNKKSFAESFGYSDETDKGCRRLCLQLMERLIKQLPQPDLNIKEDEDLTAGLERVNQYCQVVRNLKAKGLTESFWELAKFTLRLAMRYEDLSAIVDLLRQMSQKVSKNPEKIEDFEAYDDLLWQYSPALTDEMKLESIYNRLTAKLYLMKGQQEEKLKLAEEAYNKSRYYAEKYTFRSIQTYCKVLETIYLEMKQDWEELLRTVEAAVEHFKTKNYKAEGLISYFSMQKSTALTMLRQYQASEISVQEALANAEEGSNNWFKSLLLQISNALYAHEYEKAWEVIQMGLGHPKLSGSRAYDQEIFRFYEAFMILLSRGDMFGIPEEGRWGAENFRITRFMNSMPMHQADKQGGNLSLQILQALFLLEEGREDAFESKVEALAKYSQRNLEAEGEHYRSHWFIRLLNLVPRWRHNPRRLEQIAQYHLNKISARAAAGVTANIEIEAIPYEEQWELVRCLLRRKKQHRPVFRQDVQTPRFFNSGAVGLALSP